MSEFIHAEQFRLCSHARFHHADSAKPSPRVDSRWQFWRQSAEGGATPLSPRTEVANLHHLFLVAHPSLPMLPEFEGRNDCSISTLENSDCRCA